MSGISCKPSYLTKLLRSKKLKDDPEFTNEPRQKPAAALKHVETQKLSWDLTLGGARSSVQCTGLIVSRTALFIFHLPLTITITAGDKLKPSNRGLSPA